MAMTSLLLSFPSLFLQPKSSAVFKSDASFGGRRERNLRQPSSLGRFSSHVTTIDQSRFGFNRHSSLFKCWSQKQSVEEESEKIKRGEEVYEFERLFSNLNQATLKRESGTLLTKLNLFILFSLLGQYIYIYVYI